MVYRRIERYLLQRTAEPTRTELVRRSPVPEGEQETQ